MHDDDPLEWLNAVLWPGGDGGFVRLDEGRTGRWWASPSPASPHTLLPIGPRRVALRSARRYHDGKSWGARARVAAAEAATLLPGSGRFGPMARTLDAHGLDRGVIGGLAVALDVPDLRVAVTLASPKSNRKPVLGLLDTAGRRLGFAKVAPDAWVERLLDNEARWLGRRGARPLRVPAMVWHGRIDGRQVLVQEAVTAPRVLRRPPTALPPAALFAAVAGLGHRRRAPLESSGWFAALTQVLDVATPDERAVVDAVLVDADRPIELGAWHGDLAAWNLYTRRRSISVIDWEFAATDVPLGFDVCHFLLQAENETNGTETTAALSSVRPRLAAPLSALGVPAGDHDVVWRCYLLELARRTFALRAAGVDTTAVTHGRAALAALAAAQPARQGARA